MFFSAHAKPTLSITILLFASRGLAKALRIDHIVGGFCGRSHDQWHEFDDEGVMVR